MPVGTPKKSMACKYAGHFLAPCPQDVPKVFHEFHENIFFVTIKFGYPESTVESGKEFLGHFGIFNRLALCLFQNMKTPGIMDARGLVLNRQEQIKRMVRHLFKAILFVKVDGCRFCVDHNTYSTNLLRNASNSIYGIEQQ